MAVSCCCLLAKALKEWGSGQLIRNGCTVVEIIADCFSLQSSSLLACNIAPASGLETDDDISDLQVPLLLQVGQDSSTEKHFTLADPIEVRIQLQSFDLTVETTGDGLCKQAKN